MIQNNRVSMTSQEIWMNDKTEYLKSRTPSPARQASASFFSDSRVQIISGASKELSRIHTNCFPNFGPKLKTVIDDLRQARGTQRVMALMNFQGKLDGMSTSQLYEGQAYLGKLMASYFNTDDELLGALLTAVNQEIRGREIRPVYTPPTYSYPPQYPQIRSYPQAVNPRAINFQDLQNRTID